MRRKLSPDIQGQKAFAQLPQGLSADKDTQDQLRRFIQSSATKRDLKKVADDVTTDIAAAVSNVTTTLSTKAIVVSTYGAVTITHNSTGAFNLYTAEYDPEGWINSDDTEKITVREDGIYLFLVECDFYLEIGNYSEAFEFTVTSTLYNSAAAAQDTRTKYYMATGDGTIVGSTTDLASTITFAYILPKSCVVGDYIELTYGYDTYSGNDPSCAVDVRASLVKVG